MENIDRSFIGNISDSAVAWGDNSSAILGDNSSIDASKKSDIDDALKELKSHVAELSQSLTDPSQKARADAAVNMITKEAESAQPDQGTFDLSMDGLVNAANATARFGGPILAVLSKLKELLFP